MRGQCLHVDNPVRTHSRSELFLPCCPATRLLAQTGPASAKDAVHIANRNGAWNELPLRHLESATLERSE